MTAVLVALLLFGAALETASAQVPYPNRPIRIVVPFGPGGFADITMRLAGQGLSERTGQQVVIENRPSGVVPAEIVVKAAPNGYTLLFYNNALWTAPLIQATPYDMLRDFAPVTLVAMIANLLVVHPSLPAKSLAEFVRLAKSRPGMINYASGGYGSSGHLAIELFRKFTHIELVHVPYKSGGLVATALLAGEVDVSFNTIPSLITYVKAGRLRTLGVSTPQRSLSLPEVPTIAEQGYPGFSASGLAGIVAPAGTPPDAVDKIQKEVAVLLKQPALVERFVTLGLEPVGNTPAEFDKFIRADLDKWTQLTRELKITLQ